MEVGMPTGLGALHPMCLGLLIGQSLGLKPPADDGPAAEHCDYERDISVVAGTTLPAYPSMPCQSSRDFDRAALMLFQLKSPVAA